VSPSRRKRPFVPLRTVSHEAQIFADFNQAITNRAEQAAIGDGKQLVIAGFEHAASWAEGLVSTGRQGNEFIIDETQEAFVICQKQDFIGYTANPINLPCILARIELRGAVIESKATARQ
jgi:hypothetical protein